MRRAIRRKEIAAVDSIQGMAKDKIPGICVLFIARETPGQSYRVRSSASWHFHNDFPPRLMKKVK
jgi:hypothetical protein